MNEIYTEIIINSSPEKVWKVLTDFEKFPEWNPFIQEIKGNLTEGNDFNVKLVLPGSNGMNIKPKIKKVNENREFSWLGKLIMPGIFDGEHIFQIEKMDDSNVKFIHKEKFKGILASLILNKISDRTTEGFKNMNNAFKKRVESI